MKRISIPLLALVVSLSLCGCCTKHQWKDADCATPKTCKVCQETEGAPLGHVWMAATCDNPKQCQVCGDTDGTPLPHSFVVTGFYDTDESPEAAELYAKNRCTACLVQEDVLMEDTAAFANSLLPGTWMLAGIQSLEFREDGTLAMFITKDGQRFRADMRWNIALAPPQFIIDAGENTGFSYLITQITQTGKVFIPCFLEGTNCDQLTVVLEGKLYTFDRAAVQ